MKEILMFWGILGVISNIHAQRMKPNVKVEKIEIAYHNEKVKAKRLTVSSEIPMDLASAWANVKTPALLQFVAKGMITFKPVGEAFPKQWGLGQTYAIKMRVFGFLPFGGTHYLFVEKIDTITHTIATKEWDKGAKVWNHDIVMTDLGNGKIYYEDAITIYGGGMTGFITAFAKKFYTHRQLRWQMVATKNLHFAE
jgi:hypothetical protein